MGNGLQDGVSYMMCYSECSSAHVETYKIHSNQDLPRAEASNQPKHTASFAARMQEYRGMYL